MKALAIIAAAVNIAAFAILASTGSAFGVINLVIGLVLVFQITRDWEYL